MGNAAGEPVSLVAEDLRGEAMVITAKAAPGGKLRPEAGYHTALVGRNMRCHWG